MMMRMMPTTTTVVVLLLSQLGGVALASAVNPRYFSAVEGEGGKPPADPAIASLERTIERQRVSASERNSIDTATATNNNNTEAAPRYFSVKNPRPRDDDEAAASPAPVASFEVLRSHPPVGASREAGRRSSGGGGGSGDARGRPPDRRRLHPVAAADLADPDRYGPYFPIPHRDDPIVATRDRTEGNDDDGDYGSLDEDEDGDASSSIDDSDWDDAGTVDRRAERIAHNRRERRRKKNAKKKGSSSSSRRDRDRDATAGPTEEPTDAPTATMEPTRTLSPTRTFEPTGAPTTTQAPTATLEPTDTLEPTATFAPTTAPTDTFAPTKTLAPTRTLPPTGTFEPTDTAGNRGSRNGINADGTRPIITSGNWYTVAAVPSRRPPPPVSSPSPSPSEYVAAGSVLRSGEGCTVVRRSDPSRIAYGVADAVAAGFMAATHLPLGNIVECTACQSIEFENCPGVACVGPRSCEDAAFYDTGSWSSETTTSDGDGDGGGGRANGMMMRVHCLGTESCLRATFVNVAGIRCAGTDSCAAASVTEPKELTCVAEDTCRGLEIR